MKTLYSNGKLLLTGEYVVLDGALSLAVPTSYGQSLIVEKINKPKIIWQSLDENGTVWFEGEFQSNSGEILKPVQHDEIFKRLVQILNEAKKLNPHFLNGNEGFKVITKLDFPRNWGLGTSSTLINNVSQWANVNAYKLLKKTFGGSGYDIACAQNNHPITYQLTPDNTEVKQVDFNPVFKEHLYFIHLNKKQNSREGIKHYKCNKGDISGHIERIKQITEQIIKSETLETFETLINEHEKVIAQITNQIPIKALFFNDFKGTIKSLGAWGGDFILATSKTNPSAYFKTKGFNTIIPYKDMVLK